MDLISLLIAFIVFGVLFAIIYYVPVVNWIKTILYIVVGGIAAIWLIRYMIAYL